MLAVEQRGNASTFGLVLSYALQLTMLTSMTVRARHCLRVLVVVLEAASACAGCGRVLQVVLML